MTATCTGVCACTTASDCQSGQTCLAGFCAEAQACATNADCGDPTEVCAAGVCISVNAIPDGGIADAGDAGKPDGGAAVDGGRDGGSGILDGGLPGFSDGGDAGVPPVPDAGLDAGSDAGVSVPDAGPICTSRAECASGQICAAGVCGPCASDSQCGPPSSICQSGQCVSGCLPGSCAAGQLCDDALSGRCVAALGSGAPGAACTSSSDCQASAQSTVEGLCIELVSGGSVCSGLCQATAQCPSGMICDPLGAGAVCLSATLLGVESQIGTGAVGSKCTSYLSCNSYADYACGPFTGGADVCSDTCQGQGVGCPSGWSCLTQTLFDPDAGAGCAANSTSCATADPNSDCFTSAEGGDNRCHAEYRQDECFDETDLPTGATGTACTSDATCHSNWCLGGLCADPCCRSTDCGSGQGCSPVLGPDDSQLLACYPSTGTLALGQACTVGQDAACRSGFCIPDNPYVDGGAGAGYCSDTCCSDAECGAGFGCTILATDNTAGSVQGAAPFCVKL